jgi:hypothetical protein
MARLQERVRRLGLRVRELEQALVAGGRGSRSVCIDDFDAGREERCFRLAVALSPADFLVVCGGGRLEQALARRRVSEPTVLDVAVRLGSEIGQDSAVVVPLLLLVLTYFSPENPAVGAALRQPAQQILAASVGMFQTIAVESALYSQLRELCHVAKSFLSDVE